MPKRHRSASASVDTTRVPIPLALALGLGPKPDRSAKEAAAKYIATRVKHLLAHPRTPEECDALREKIKAEIKDSCDGVAADGTRTRLMDAARLYASLTRALKVYDDTVFDGQLRVLDDADVKAIPEDDALIKKAAMCFQWGRYECGGGGIFANSTAVLLRQFTIVKERFKRVVSANVRKKTHATTAIFHSFVGFLLLLLEHEITHSLLAKLHWVDKVSHNAVPVHGLEFYCTLSAWTAQRGAVVGLRCSTPASTMKYLHRNLMGNVLNYNSKHEAELNFICNRFVLADMKCLIDGHPRLPPLDFKQPAENKGTLSPDSRVVPPPSFH